MDQTDQTTQVTSSLHKIRCRFRFLDNALVDLVASSQPLLGIAMYYDIPAWRGVAGALPLSIAVHALFMIDTPLTNKFFDMDAHFALKLGMLGLTYLSLEGFPSLG